MAAAEPQNKSLAYVSRAPGELDKFVRLEQQGQNGRITRNQERINELEVLLNAAVNVIGGFNMGEINDRVEDILKILRELQSRNFDIYPNISLNFEDYSVIHGSLNVIAGEINQPVDLVDLPNFVRNIPNLAIQPPLLPQILFNFIILNPHDGWENIKNTVQQQDGEAGSRPAIDSKLYSKASINNDTNIANPNVSNTEVINTYLEECGKHQEAYITKHNEIRILFEHLKGIIKIIKLILNVIRTLSQVKSIQKRRRIGALPSVKIPRALLENLGQYKADQENILNKSAAIIKSAEEVSTKASQQGGFFQLGGAAAAPAPAQQQQKIILAEDTITVPPELAEVLTPGDIIKIVMQTPGQQQQEFYIKIESPHRPQQNTFTITIMPRAANIAAFNNLTYQQQQAAMTLNRLGIDHSKFLSVAGHLEQMMRNSFIEFDRQLDRMHQVDIRDPIKVNNQTDPNIPFDEEHQHEIQNILYNCYDLQILYLIKHVEVVNLFKFILFHYDILLNNLVILINLLKLFDVLKINIQTILGNVSVRSIIKNMQELIPGQRNAMQSIFPQPPQQNTDSQAGGAAAVPGLNNQIKSQLSEDLQQNLEQEINEYVSQIRKVLQDTGTQYEDTKLSALEKSIGDAIIRISTQQNQPENAVNKANKEKLYKAYRAIRILRLSKLVQNDWATEELKAKASNQIAALKWNTAGGDDLFTAIGRMQGQDNILADVYRTHAKKQLDESSFTQAPVEGQPRELQQILDNYYKTRNLQVCKVGDPNSCSKNAGDIDSAKTLINYIFGEILKVQIQNDDMNVLTQPTTLKLFQLADYLYDKYQEKEEITSAEILDWLMRNEYNDFLEKVLERRAEEEAARRAAEEEARREEARRAAEEEARREEARRAAEEEARREEARRAAEEEARREEARRAAEEEARRAREERVKREEEAARRAREEEAARRAREEEEARRAREERVKREEEEARRAREERVKREEEEARRAEELEQHKSFLENTIKPLGRLKLKLFVEGANINPEYQASWKTFLSEYKSKGRTGDEIIGILGRCHELMGVASESIQYGDETFTTIKSIMGNLDNYPNLLANLREVIFQACRVVVKIRSENEEDKKLSSQSGGYKMNEVITVEKGRDTSTIKLGDICKMRQIGISDDKQKKKYGPFSAVYLPGDTQEYVYKELFGNKRFNQEPSKYNTIPKTSQELMEQLRLEKNVVIFGFGFSGSGKTYTLIEGASNPVDSGGAAAAGAGDTRQKSLLELFILDNIETIREVDFEELYPKENQEYTKKIKDLDIFKSISRGIVDANAFVEMLKSRLKQIEEYRYKNLTICATPNNDNSSRSFLMIKLILLNGASLVFFDMPGTESTVRIRSQFMGNVFYLEKEKTTNIGSTDLSTLGSGIGSYKNLSNFVKLYTTKQNVKDHITLVGLKSEDTVPTEKRIDYINAYYNEIQQYELRDAQDKILGAGYSKCPIENHFKESIITAKTLQSIFIDVKARISVDRDKIQLQTAKYIITMSEAITLFFNGYPEKTFREFLLNHANTEEDIHIKMLTPDKMLELVKTFLSRFIYKKKADGSAETYKYFTPPEQPARSTATQLDDITKNDDINKNVIKIFNLHLSTDGSKKDELVLLLRDFNFDKLPFYELEKVEAQEIKFKQNGLFKDVKFDNKFIMIKCFMMLLCYVLQKIQESKLASKTTESIAILSSSKTNPNSYYGLSMVLILTYKFINFIIEQGESIMSTLEHLKYYFLFNMNSYDKLDKFKCFSAPVPDDPTKKQSLSATSRTSTQPTKKQTQPQEKECGNLLYLTNPASYTYDTKIGDSVLKEKVIIGGMVEYGLMSLLQTLNGREPDLTKLGVKQRALGDSYLDLASTVSRGDGAAAAETFDKKALFVMFANIKAHVSKEDAAKDFDVSMLENTKLICNAEVDTLEFAQSVSSTATQSMPEPVAAGAAAGAAASYGGALKSSRIKKYLTSRIKQYTLKRLNKSGHKSIYSRRSRKYQA